LLIRRPKELQAKIEDQIRIDLPDSFSNEQMARPENSRIIK
jgi:hypothetical protein